MATGPGLALPPAMLASLLALTLAAQAPTLPAGTTLNVRLLDSAIGTPAARGTALRALVIAPATLGGRVALAAGDTVLGTVVDAGVERAGGERHYLVLRFTRLVVGRGSVLGVDARVADVPNARETVDSAGRILGPERPGVLRSRNDWAALLLGTADPLAGVVYFTAFQGESIERHRRVAYAPGVELTLRLRAPLALPAWPVVAVMPSAPADVARALATAPLRVVTAKRQLPADVITLALVGSEADVRAAFAAAGWTTPERSSIRADLATLADAARARGFAEQPISTLTLDDKAPALAFEKVVNSMARRHHLRLWPWRVVGGRPLWLVTASRDDGVEFSRAARSFTHHTDPAIDVERGKVVSDLEAAGVVRAASLLTRVAPATPVFVDDGSARVVSDWRLAALVLNPTTPAAGSGR